MKISRKFNVLWLSDIHFQEAYEDRSIFGQLSSYLDKAFSTALNKHTNKSPIIYMILSGDLAMKGNAGDYNAFRKIFLEKLLDKFLTIESEQHIPIPRVLIIPGNHDVNWCNTEFLLEYLSQIQNTSKKYEERVDFLKNQFRLFSELFLDYTKFINDISQSPKYEKFFDLTESYLFDYYKPYKEKRLFGYILDKKNGVIIMLLNSAWFSIGDNFNDLLASSLFLERSFRDDFSKYNVWCKAHENEIENLIKKIQKHESVDGQKKYVSTESLLPNDLKSSYNSLISLLKQKDWISEYSKQVSGMNLWKDDEFKKVLEKYKDYTIITCMHHPLNWLDWQEQYDSGSNVDSSSKNLNFILQHTDLFLTGHEHVPIQFSGFIKSHNYFHLRGGCFLEDSRKAPLSLKNNWFSIINIDTRLRRVEQFKYQFLGEDFNGHWQESNSCDERVVILNSRSITLSSERENEIVTLWPVASVDTIKSYIDKTKLELKNPSSEFVEKISYSGASYRVFLQKNAIETFVYILAISNQFYSSINSIQFFEKIENLVKMETVGKVVIRFVVADLFVDASFNNEYKEGLFMREIIRDSAFTRADILFDKFRHSFFERFEKDNEKMKELGKYSTLQFINHVIPYWELESNLASGS